MLKENEDFGNMVRMAEQARLQRDVDDFLKLKDQIDSLKESQKALQDSIIAQAANDMVNTKEKSVKYNGSGGNHVRITRSDKAVINYPDFLPHVFGAIYDTSVKETVKYEFAKDMKDVVIDLCNGDFERMDFEDIIRSIPLDDEGARELIRCRVKGKNFDFDKKTLMTIGGLDEETASTYAYFLKESLSWRKFVDVLRINETAEKADEFLDTIQQAVSVQTSFRIAKC